jgi:hypothetical protein
MWGPASVVAVVVLVASAADAVALGPTSGSSAYDGQSSCEVAAQPPDAVATSGAVTGTGTLSCGVGAPASSGEMTLRVCAQSAFFADLHSIGVPELYWHAPGGCTTRTATLVPGVALRVTDGVPCSSALAPMYRVTARAVIRRPDRGPLTMVATSDARPGVCRRP